MDNPAEEAKQDNTLIALAPQVLLPIETTLHEAQVHSAPHLKTSNVLSIFSFFSTTSKSLQVKFPEEG